MFLQVLTEGLCGQALPLRRSWRERLVDATLLLGETVLAPLGLLIVLSIGGGALFGWWLVLVGDSWVLYAVLIWGFITVSVAPAFIGASKVHRRFWTGIALSTNNNEAGRLAATTAEGNG